MLRNTRRSARPSSTRARSGWERAGAGELVSLRPYPRRLPAHTASPAKKVAGKVAALGKRARAKRARACLDANRFPDVRIVRLRCRAAILLRFHLFFAGKVKEDFA